MEEDKRKTKAYLQRVFKAFYKTNAKTFVSVPNLPQREFAFTTFRGRGMMRHIGFPTSEYLWKYLKNNGPSNSYRSAAYYEKPGADNMEKKDYIACDFVFDIDADHIPTDCRNNHNYFYCKSCMNETTGGKPDKCEKCGHRKFDDILWICEECLDVSKHQVKKLVDGYLTKDFGLELKDIEIYFSGHRGYHAQIPKEKIINLDSDARREIIDYITGEGFSFDFWNFKKKKNSMMGFDINQIGWPGKIARELFDVLNHDDTYIRKYFAQPIYQEPLSTKIINNLLNNENKNNLIEILQNTSRNWQISGISDKSWEKIIYIIRDNIKADVDVVVSYDLHRLIRMEGSIHSKSGFYKKWVDYENIDDFDPLIDALSFPQSKDNQLKIEIIARICPQIRIGDTSYGPYQTGEIISLPLNAALFLLCKGVAILIGN